jgi:aromatic-L-amino-acid decarboxylase
MDAQSLARAMSEDRDRGRRPLFVCANAGTTNTGSIDPLEHIGDACREQGAWFHVDGAYGGFAAATPEGRARLAGIARADSLTLDPHKWLYCPMGVGCILVRDPSTLREAFRAHGEYLKDLPKDEVNFLDFGPELSRPARALPVWMLLRSAGADAIRDQIEEDLRLARVAAKAIASDARFELVLEPELSVVAFRLRARPGESEEARAARDADLMERSLASGEVMFSTTRLRGRSALRLVVQNHRTTEDDVRRAVRVLQELST